MDLRLNQHRWSAIIYSRLLVAVHRYLRIVTPTYMSRMILVDKMRKFA